MTSSPSNQHPNDHELQALSRLEQLLADRAVAGLDDHETIELRRLLAAAGQAEDESLDLAAAACARATGGPGGTPLPTATNLPPALLAALDREADAWCAGVGSSPSRQVAGRLVRTPVVLGKRFTREWGGWIAAAACLCFGVYAWNNRPAPVTIGPDLTANSTLAPVQAATILPTAPFERAIARIDSWFNRGTAVDVVPLGAASPDSGTDLAIGQIMWNADENAGVLKIRQSEAGDGAQRTYRVSVVCAHSGERAMVEAGSVTVEPGQKDVLIPLESSVAIRSAAAFVVSVCSHGPLGVTQSENVVGIGHAAAEGMAPPPVPVLDR